MTTELAKRMVESCAVCLGRGAVVVEPNVTRACAACDGRGYANRPRKTDAELLAALDKLGDDLLDPNYPIDLVEEELRAYGLDPEKIARDGVAFVERLKAQRPYEACAQLCDAKAKQWREMATERRADPALAEGKGVAFYEGRAFMAEELAEACRAAGPHPDAFKRSAR